MLPNYTFILVYEYLQFVYVCVLGSISTKIIDNMPAVWVGQVPWPIYFGKSSVLFVSSDLHMNPNAYCDFTISLTTSTFKYE